MRSPQPRAVGLPAALGRPSAARELLCNRGLPPLGLRVTARRQVRLRTSPVVRTVAACGCVSAKDELPIIDDHTVL